MEQLNLAYFFKDICKTFRSRLMKGSYNLCCQLSGCSSRQLGKPAFSKVKDRSSQHFHSMCIT